MRGKKGKPGIWSMLSSILFLAIGVAIVIAIFRLNGIKDGETLYDWAKKKSDQWSECVHDRDKCFKIKDRDVANSNTTNNSNSTNNSSTKKPGKAIAADKNAPDKSFETVTNKTTDVKSIKDMLLNVKIAKPDKSAYNRIDWKHWSNYKSSCWNIREQVLKNQSKSIVLLDKNKKVTKDVNIACHIKSGEWIDPYTGKTVKSIKELDIDHIVPLSYANEHGASKWAPAKKEQFANDLENLVAVSLRENRSKGAKGPSEYMPPNAKYGCEYVGKFVNIVNKYNLSITSQDKRVILSTLQKCN